MTVSQKLAGVLASTALWIAAAGCTTLDPDQFDAGDYRRVEFEEKFRIYKARCLASGGQVYIDAKQRLPRSGVPRPGDYYSCV